MLDLQIELILGQLSALYVSVIILHFYYFKTTLQYNYRHHNVPHSPQPNLLIMIDIQIILQVLVVLVLVIFAQNNHLFSSDSGNLNVGSRTSIRNFSPQMSLQWLTILLRGSWKVISLQQFATFWKTTLEPTKTPIGRATTGRRKALNPKFFQTVKAQNGRAVMMSACPRCVITPGPEGFKSLLSLSLSISGFIALSFLSAKQPRSVLRLNGLRYSTC